MARNVTFAELPDVIIPVPLHRRRLRYRGFNQALLLSHELTTHFSVPLSFDNLMRVRYTVPQVELSAADRRMNVEGAFRLSRPEHITGKAVLLVDDVFTTGATINECAAVCMQADAARVTALTLARAPE